jgi:hypothetical protein
MAPAFAEDGRPVTAQDISGKTICWEDGRRNTFAVDGRYTSTAGRHSKWSVIEPGVVKAGHLEHQIEVLPDGQLHSHRFRGRSTRGIYVDHWGKACA